MPTYSKVSNKHAQFSFTRCRLGHASFATFKVALILRMQKSNISCKILMKNILRMYIAKYYSKNENSWIFLH